MRSRVSIVIGSLLGATLIYCGQSALENTDGRVVFDGGVPDARADSSTPPSFEKVAEGQLSPSPGKVTSNEIDVGKYREIVVYVKPVGDKYCSISDTRIYFYPFPGAPYRTNHMYPGRLLVNGPVMRLELNDPESCALVQYYVMGLK